MAPACKSNAIEIAARHGVAPPRYHPRDPRAKGSSVHCRACFRGAATVCRAATLVACSSAAVSRFRRIGLEFQARLLDAEHIIEACRTPAAPVKHGKEQAPFSCGSFGVTDVLDPRTES
jgi:hypothetical protein